MRPKKSPKPNFFFSSDFTSKERKELQTSHKNNNIVRNNEKTLFFFEKCVFAKNFVIFSKISIIINFFAKKKKFAPPTPTNFPYENYEAPIKNYSL